VGKSCAFRSSTELKLSVAIHKLAFLFVLLLSTRGHWALLKLTGSGFYWPTQTDSTEACWIFGTSETELWIEKWILLFIFYWNIKLN